MRQALTVLLENLVSDKKPNMRRIVKVNGALPSGMAFEDHSKNCQMQLTPGLVSSLKKINCIQNLKKLRTLSYCSSWYKRDLVHLHVYCTVQ